MIGKKTLREDRGSQSRDCAFSGGTSPAAAPVAAVVYLVVGRGGGVIGSKPDKGDLPATAVNDRGYSARTLGIKQTTRLLRRRPQQPVEKHIHERDDGLSPVRLIQLDDAHADERAQQILRLDLDAQRARRSRVVE